METNTGITSGTTSGQTATSGYDTTVTTQEPSVAEQAKQKAQDVIQQIPRKTGELADQARNQVKNQLATQKEQAVGGLGSISHALRQTGQTLRESEQPKIGQFAESAAQMVDDLSDYLRGRDVDDLIGEVTGFARRQPTLFVGGAFALGFLVARFLKSSNEDTYGAGTVSASTPYDGSQTGYAASSGLRSELLETDVTTPAPTTVTDVGTTSTGFTTGTTAATATDLGPASSTPTGTAAGASSTRASRTSRTRSTAEDEDAVTVRVDDDA